MIVATPVRTLDLSAASGLVLLDGRFHAVADDENALFVFGLQGESRRIALLDETLPLDKPTRKARKADFEILFALAGRGLLAMGSGSRPTRERAVWIDAQETVVVIDTTPLCALLRGAFPELNLEGAAVVGDEFVLLQRASRKDPRNALAFFPRSDLEAALASTRFEPSRAPRIVVLDLGEHEGLPWSVTDLAVLDDGDLLLSVVLEDTCDAYEDGACLGSALARLAPDGALRWFERLDTAGKVEGVAVDGNIAWLVTDADDRAVPAQLLRATLP